MVAADVVYWTDLQAPLAATLKALCVDHGAVALIAYRHRWKANNKFFTRMLPKHGMDVTLVKEVVGVGQHPTRLDVAAGESIGADEPDTAERRIIDRLYRLEAKWKRKKKKKNKGGGAMHAHGRGGEGGGESGAAEGAGARAAERGATGGGGEKKAAGGAEAP